PTTSTNTAPPPSARRASSPSRRRSRRPCRRGPCRSARRARPALPLSPARPARPGASAACTPDAEARAAARPACDRERHAPGQRRARSGERTAERAVVVRRMAGARDLPAVAIAKRHLDALARERLVGGGCMYATDTDAFVL